MMTANSESTMRVTDVSNLFQALLNLDDVSRALASGFIQGLATREMIENANNTPSVTSVTAHLKWEPELERRDKNDSKNWNCRRKK